MPLTGQAKTDYQREYMRKRRSNKGLTNAGSNTKGLTPKPETQSYNPMKVGYVPLTRATG